MKTYSEEEINSLIEELQKELPEILKAEAVANKEELAKAEAGKLMAGSGSGGEKMAVKKEEQSYAKETKLEGSPKADYVKETSVSGDGKGNYYGETSLGKEESSASSSSSSSDDKMKKDEPPAAASASDEAPAEKPEAPAPEAAPEAAAEQPQDEQSLEQAYGQLSDEDLRAHYEALKGVLMQRMSAQQGGDQMGAPAASPSPASPAPAASPSPSAQPQMAMSMKSEAQVDAAPLSKAAEEKVANLEAQFASVTKLLEMMLTQPAQKAVTTMAEYVAKSELEKPKAKNYSRKEVIEQLSKAAKDPSLKRMDRDQIDRYVLEGDNFKDIQHLLK